MQKTSSKQRDERRTGSDRRLQVIEHEFPFVDSHGHLVTYERRKHDRRRSEPNMKQRKNYA